MGIKIYKPTSPGRRGMSVNDYSDLDGVQKPEGKLVSGKHSTGGRNSYGRITSRFRGGGHKRRFREVDFKRSKYGISAKVAGIQYDPNRSAHIALLHYEDGEKAYVLAAANMKVGDTVLSSRRADIKPGNSLPLKDIPA